MSADSQEAAFQQDIIDQMVAGGWKIGEPGRSVGWTLLSVVQRICLGQECPIYWVTQ